MINLMYSTSTQRGLQAPAEVTSNLKTFLVEGGFDLGKVIFLDGVIVGDVDQTFEELGKNEGDNVYLTISSKQDGNL